MSNPSKNTVVSKIIDTALRDDNTANKLSPQDRKNLSEYSQGLRNSNSSSTSRSSAAYNQGLSDRQDPNFNQPSSTNPRDLKLD